MEKADMMVVIITGANRGIGKAIVQTLATSISTPSVIYATSRSGASPAVQKTSNIEIRTAKLDIASPSSVRVFAEKIAESHDAVDVLINNAAAHDADKMFTPEVVRMVLDTNVRGTLDMCKTLLPLMRQSTRGRIVNISSTGSSLANYKQEIRQRFRDPQMDLSGLEEMLQEYQQHVNDRTETDFGWPKSAYSVSKAGVNALTSILARQNPEIIINCCCPGWVDTDMGSIAGPRPPKSPEDGAKIPIRLGFTDVSGVTGRYWGNPSVADTGDGQVLQW